MLVTIRNPSVARVTDELYQSVRPMLATSGGKLLLCSTPFGRRGFLWREWSGQFGLTPSGVHRAIRAHKQRQKLKSRNAA